MVEGMYKKGLVVGIIVFFIAVSVAPVVNALTVEKNEINEGSESNCIVNSNIKLDPPWPTLRHLEVYDIGLISNLRDYGFGYKFNCVNVFEWFWVNDECYFSHYTNGEELYVSGSYRGILTNHFVFAHWYLGC